MRPLRRNLTREYLSWSIFDDLFALMDFLDFEDAKDRHPVTAKEFGIQ